MRRLDQNLLLFPYVLVANFYLALVLSNVTSSIFENKVEIDNFTFLIK